MDEFAPNIAPLPRPPALTHYLLEYPYPVVGALLALGILLYFALSRRGRAREGMAAGLVGLVGAAGVLTAGMLVTTQREVLLKRTRELVDAVAAGDGTRLDRLLGPDARLSAREPTVRGVVPDGAARDVIIAEVESNMRAEYRLREHRIVEAYASIDGPNAGRTLLRVRVVPEIYPAPHASWWLLEWRLDAGEWRVFVIEPRWFQFGAGEG